MSVPLPPDEQRRLGELRRYALLDTPPEKAFDDVTALAARIFKVPISTVTLIDEDRQWFKSCVGLETREVGRNFVFSVFALLTDAVMIVPDARADPRFADNPLVVDNPRIRFYAGAPLKTLNGLNLGTLSIIDTAPRGLSDEAAEMLVSLAALVVREIELRYEIGERLRTAERLRLLEAAMEQSDESIIITTAKIDLPGPEIVFVNPAFTRTTGYSAQEAVGKTPRILHGPKTDRAILNGVRTQLERGGEFSFEAINYRKDGSDFILSTHISPIHGENGKPTHFICTQIDTTERDRAARLLQQAKQEAEQANRKKSEFLSHMSHELRTPMNAILGFAELLEMEGHGAENAESVGQIISAGKHLLGLINEVLDNAAVESGKLALTLEPVSAVGALEETLSLMRPIATQQHVRLELLAGDLDHQVLADAQRFRQVLLNLLSNAVKFNRDGGLVVVSCEKREDFLRVKVTDAGGGIPAAKLAKLFVPFERLGAAEKAIEGAGLGLALSKHLVEAMNGRIGVESMPGEGSTFWVELPLSHVSPGARPARKPDAPGPGSSGASRSAVPITLLCIEDNLSNLRLIQRILARRPEVKLISATLGEGGLALAREHLPDLVLLDIHLPDIPGEEILRQLRADPRTQHIPIIMVSADATLAQIERLRSAGANDYLTKPIEVRKFLALIDAFKLRVAAPPKPSS
jgi:PAS domain S-box-containing protein